MGFAEGKSRFKQAKHYEFLNFFFSFFLFLLISKMRITTNHEIFMRIKQGTNEALSHVLVNVKNWLLLGGRES